MHNFQHKISEKLAIFSPFLRDKITISSDYFVISTGTVADFVQEIEQTAQLASQQEQAIYTAFHSKRLVQQFDCLKAAVDKLARKQGNTLPKFQSPYRFAKNVKNLPRCKQLEEYHKALRALNEKLSWLMEQNYSVQNKEHRLIFQAQIQETEYRRLKCLAAIEELE